VLAAQLARDPGPMTWRMQDAADLDAAAARLNLRTGED